MSREWKPGDVATATVKGRENVRLVAGWSKYDPQLRWCEISPRWGDGDDDECWFFPNDVTDHRPLAVIDPEDREAVERLLTDYLTRYDGMDSVAASGEIDCMQDALRQFANPTPPKPDEPRQLASVAVDNEGRNWVRVFRPGCGEHDMSRGPWACGDLRSHWSEIAAVRVLSEGVQP